MTKMAGFPHSEIHGSKLIRSSPQLIAAYHVLHRLCMPRHPPNALKTLDRSHYHHAPTAVQHVDPIFVVLRSVDHQTDKSERRSKRSINYSVNLPAWTRGGLAFPEVRTPQWGNWTTLGYTHADVQELIVTDRSYTHEVPQIG